MKRVRNVLNKNVWFGSLRASHTHPKSQMHTKRTHIMRNTAQHSIGQQRIVHHTVPQNSVLSAFLICHSLRLLILLIFWKLYSLKYITPHTHSHTKTQNGVSLFIVLLFVERFLFLRVLLLKRRRRWRWRRCLRLCLNSPLHRLFAKQREQRSASISHKNHSNKIPHQPERKSAFILTVCALY